MGNFYMVLTMFINLNFVVIVYLLGSRPPRLKLDWWLLLVYESPIVIRIPVN